MELGLVGVWNVGLRNEDLSVRGELQDAAAELEDLGYGAIWLGGSPDVDHARPLLEATSTIVVATGILPIWSDDAAAVAGRHAALTAIYPGRFLLGLGVSHLALVKAYDKPYSAMVAYLDALDAAATPVPKEDRVLAALGPRMLALARDRAGGAHPYLVTPTHTTAARKILGPQPLLAPEVKVVLESDRTSARHRARQHLSGYLTLPNYTNNLLRLGFNEEDFTNGGSDRLIDATFAWGADDAIRRRIVEFHDAGADHAVVQVVGGDRMDLPREEWRRLAGVLELHSG